jgi:hypothetical protein
VRERLDAGFYAIPGGGKGSHRKSTRVRTSGAARLSDLNQLPPTPFSHAAIDQRNAERDRLVAGRLRHDRRILGRARSNLRRWMARDGKRIRPVFAEWWRVLERLSVGEIADFLVSDTPKARRLRQSSPFASLVIPRGLQGARKA